MPRGIRPVKLQTPPGPGVPPAGNIEMGSTSQGLGADGLPIHFEVTHKWPLMAQKSDLLPSTQRENGCWAAAALVCVTMRALAWHQRPLTAAFGMDQIYQFGMRKVGEPGLPEDVFNANFGGVRRLTTVQDIKKELMAFGPVVAQTFLTTHNFKGTDEGAYDPDALNGAKRGLHSMVLMGWKLTRTGDVWIVRNSWGPFSHNVEINFGQSGIDDNVIAPAMSMSQFVWQSGPLWKCDLLDGPWTSWGAISVARDEQSFMDLLTVLGLGQSTVNNVVGMLIVLHPVDLPAKSYRYKIRSWSIAEDKFVVTMDKLADEQQSLPWQDIYVRHPIDDLSKQFAILTVSSAFGIK